jgi:hypothetical protein
MADKLLAHLLSITRPQVQTATFPRRLQSASQARQFVTNVAGRHPAAGDAVLLTSEMVTNSLLHAHEAATITVTEAAAVTVTVAVNAAVIRVDVCSGFPCIPCIPCWHGDAEDDRGFQLVNRIAQRWGFTRDEERTCCWFEVTAAPAA